MKISSMGLGGHGEGLWGVLYRCSVAKLPKRSAARPASPFRCPAMPAGPSTRRVRPPLRTALRPRPSRRPRPMSDPLTS